VDVTNQQETMMNGLERQVYWDNVYTIRGLDEMADDVSIGIEDADRGDACLGQALLAPSATITLWMESLLCPEWKTSAMGSK